MFPNTIQNDASIKNNDNIQSCDISRKQNYSIQTTSIPNHKEKRIATTSESILNLHKPTILPPVGKYYMCFQKDGKTAQAARCIKPRIMTKVIDYFLSIDTFEQQCVVLKGMLQSLQLKDHAETIIIDQYLRNNALYEHKCLENIKKLYKNVGKCDGEQQLKYIIEATVFSTPEVFNGNSPIYPMKSTPVKKPSDRKSLCLLTKILDV